MSQSRFDKSEWWRSLDPTWKRIFKQAIDINHAPTDDELNQILKLETIDFRGNPYVISLEPLQWLSQLRKLNCSRTKIRTLEKICGLVLLDEVDCCFTDVASLTPLANCKHLWNLNCSNTRLESLNGLEEIDDLAYLDCSNTSVGDLTVLESLNKLRFINCDDTNVREIDFLKNRGVKVSCANTPAEELAFAKRRELSFGERLTFASQEVFTEKENMLAIESEPSGPSKAVYKRKRNEKILVGYLMFIFLLIAIGFWIGNEGGEEAESEVTVAADTVRSEVTKRDTERASVQEHKKREVTIDGYDPATKSIINPINLWANYQERSYAGSVRHGEKVFYIERKGDGVLVETKSGLRGWVTYFFISEFR